MRIDIKKIFRKDIIAVLSVFILGFPTWRTLLSKGYFTMHDDLQVLRLWEMEKCFLNGQIPCRWAPDMGAGFGQPLFNFYSAFPYYFGMFFRLFGFQFVDIVKILFLFSLLLSGIFMYFLAKEFFGRFPALVASVFYMYAPYRAVDIYVRGAMAEAWAFVFFPIIFLAIYKFVKEEKMCWFIGIIFSLSALFLSHNIMTMIFTPFAILWGIFSLAVLKKWKVFSKLSLSFLWAVGLSSFFLIPAFFEKKFVRIDTLTSGYFDFHNHFVYKGQLLFSRFWGYGGSHGASSEMSFQIGWPHWWLVCLALPLIFFLLIRKKFLKEVFCLVFFLFIFFVSVFLTHRTSVFIWEKVPLMPFIQFPWRFLGLIVFASSFLSGGVIFVLRKIRFRKISVFLSLIILISAMLLNVQYFKPEQIYPGIDDNFKLSGKELEKQQLAALLDYLPKNVKEIPKGLAPVSPWVIDGKAIVSEYAKRSNFWRFTVDVTKEARIKVPIVDFPRWEVVIDQKPVTFSSDNPEGVIEVVVPPGKHTIVGFFRDTPLRSFANGLTLFSFFSLISLIVILSREDEETV